MEMSKSDVEKLVRERFSKVGMRLRELGGICFLMAIRSRRPCSFSWNSRHRAARLVV
jgi:hypothetical protein